MFFGSAGASPSQPMDSSALEPLSRGISVSQARTLVKADNPRIR